MSEQVAQTQNPLITKANARIPGTVQRLPSLGVFYENTNILAEDVDNGEILVYPMRLRDELRMKAVDAIFQGSAVTDTIKYCVPQINDPSKLVAEDVDYLLTVIKKLTHGNTITYKDVCFKDGDVDPETANAIAEKLAKQELDDSAREDTYKINEDELARKIENGEAFDSEDLKEESDGTVEKEITSGLCEFFIPIDHFIQNSKPINPETVHEKMVFQFQDFEIESRPITFDQYKELSMMRLKNENEMDNDEYANHVADFSNANIFSRIKRVDDITDPNIIKEWVESLSLKSRTELFTELEKGLDWGMDFNYEITCAKCGKSKKTDQSYLNPLYFFLTS